MRQTLLLLGLVSVPALVSSCGSDGDDAANRTTSSTSQGSAAGGSGGAGVECIQGLESIALTPADSKVSRMGFQRVPKSTKPFSQ